jgi:hypothetical protein
MTPDAFFRVQDRLSVRAGAQRLVPAVCTGDDAAPAADTVLTVKFRENHCVSFQNVCRLAHGIQSEAARRFDEAEFVRFGRIYRWRISPDGDLTVTP